MISNEQNSLNSYSFNKSSMNQSATSPSNRNCQICSLTVAPMDYTLLYYPCIWSVACRFEFYICISLFHASDANHYLFYQLTDFGLSKIGLINSTVDLSGPETDGSTDAFLDSLNLHTQQTDDRHRQSAVGTPDYLAPEILLGTEHGLDTICIQVLFKYTGQLK